MWIILPDAIFTFTLHGSVKHLTGEFFTYADCLHSVNQHLVLMKRNEWKESACVKTFFLSAAGVSFLYPVSFSK